MPKQSSLLSSVREMAGDIESDELDWDNTHTHTHTHTYIYCLLYRNFKQLKSISISISKYILTF
jgi:hypothetical protein